MIFGSLNEKEVEDISRILESENVQFNVIKDEGVLSSNKDSLNNNLRYLHGPDLSNNFLAIEIEADLSSLSEKSKEQLLTYGITDDVPEEFKDQNFEVSKPEPIDLVKGQKRVVGLTYGLCVLLGLIALFIGCIRG